MERNLNLDFVKGFLVISMTLYHAMNYFSNYAPDDYSYIRWITGSFVFISGFIVSTIYDDKYKKNIKSAYKRLVTRGIKLILLFTFINFLLGWIGATNYKNIHFNLTQFVYDFVPIYITGNSKITAFQILVPISYVLMIAPIYLHFRNSKYLILIPSLILIILYQYYLIDIYNSNLTLIGIVGILFGFSINDIFNKFSIKNKSLIFILFILLCFLMKYFVLSLTSYIFSVILVFKLVYDFSKTVNMNNIICDTILMIGQYTLLCYLMQIVYLHLLLKLFPINKTGFDFELITIILSTNLFLYVLCKLTSAFRARYIFINKFYKTIFC